MAEMSNGKPGDPIAQRQGARLRLLRAEKARELGRELTQAEVAEVARVTEAAYRSYERGRHRIPYEVVEPLARFYGVTVTFLLALEEEPPLSDKARLVANYTNQMSDRAQNLMVQQAADLLRSDRRLRSAIDA